MISIIEYSKWIHISRECERLAIFTGRSIVFVLRLFWNFRYFYWTDSLLLSVNFVISQFCYLFWACYFASIYAAVNLLKLFQVQSSVSLLKRVTICCWIL